MGAGWGSGEMPFYFVVLLSARKAPCPAQGDGIGGCCPVLGAGGLCPSGAAGTDALGAVGALGCCHVRAEHQEAPWAGVTKGSADPCAGSLHGGAQPGSCLPGWWYLASGPLSSRAILGVCSGCQGCRRALAGPCFSEPQCSMLGVRTGVGLCLLAAADICLLRLSRNGEPLRGWFTSFLGFVSCVSWLQAGQALLAGTRGSSCCRCPSSHPASAPLPALPTVVSESGAAAAR